MRRILLISFVSRLLVATGGVVAACGSTSGSSAVTAPTSTAAATETTVPGSDATVTTQTAGTTEGTGDYTATETSVTSASKTITISTVTTGSGDDTVTYYVADVQLAEGLYLESAFANGEYGGKARTPPRWPRPTMRSSPSTATTTVRATMALSSAMESSTGTCPPASA